MELLDTALLRQLPVVALIVGMFVWFWREMKASRKECDEAMNRMTESLGETVERNTRAITDLDRTISNLRFSYDQSNDRRKVGG